MVSNQYQSAEKPVAKQKGRALKAYGGGSRTITREGMEYIKRWEGLHLQAYICAGGSLTIGYGHTATAGSPAVTKGMIIDKNRAETILQKDLRQFESAINRIITADLTDNQFAALVSFAYNVGIPAFQKSRIPSLINSGQTNAVPAELMRYVYAKGQRLHGLVNRRAAEAGLWAKGSFVSSAYEVASLNPLRFFAPKLMAPAAGSFGGMAGIATGNGPVQWALAAAMIACILLCAWYVIRHRR